MAFEDVKKVWMNGVLVDFEDAKIHVLTHVVHYGSSLFEGTRCYNTKRGPMVFRLAEHTRRLFDSCKIYRIEIPYTQDEINEAVLATVRANEFDACYIRPVVYRGFNTLGVNPFPCPVDVAIGVWKWGKYLGAEALERGVDVKVSSWTRMAPNTHPAIAKASANYMNSQLIKMEALIDGYSEGIGLDIRGFVSEGSGENIFLVRDGRILTPSMSSSILPGITRDTVITLARSLGYTVEETTIPRESLYIADEVFFTGTAAEITPIRSVDKIVVGNGARGAVTQKLQEAFFRIVEEGVGDEWGWLTPVAGAAAQRPVMLKQVK